MSLFEKTKSGVIWTFVNSIFIRGVFFIVIQLWLADILGPESFAYIGIITIFVSLGTALIESGFKYSIIRTKNLQNIDKNSIYYGNLLFGLSLFIIVYFAAPWVAIYFDQPLLENYIKVYSFVFFIDAFSIVQSAILQREMQFKRIAIYNMVGMVVSLIAVFYMVYLDFGIWAYIYFMLINSFVNTLIYWIFSDWYPKLEFSKKIFLKHFNYGYKLSLNTVLSVGFNSIYDVVIGKMNFSNLGLYNRASVYNKYPVNILTSLTTRVSFPALSKVKENEVQVSRVYRQIMTSVFWVVVPLMLFTATTAKPLFLILGEEWLPVVPYFQILAFASIFYPIQNLNLNILILYGKSGLVLKIEFIKRIAFIFIIIIALQFSIYIFVASQILIGLINYTVNAIYAQKLIKYSLKSQIKDLLPILLINLFLCVLLYMIQWQIEINNPIIFLLISSSIYIGILLFITYFWMPQIFQLIKRVIVSKTV